MNVLQTVIGLFKFLHSDWLKVYSQNNSSVSSDHTNYSMVEISDGWSYIYMYVHNSLIDLLTYFISGHIGRK